MKRLKIIKFITEDETGDRQDNHLGGMGGFFQDGMRWKDYKNQYKKIAHANLEELRKKIVENNVRCTGEELQNGYVGIPLWSDDSVSTYSWRGWGDLMAAVWSEHENKDYCYMDFYM